MGLEPTTFCMASRRSREDDRRRQRGDSGFVSALPRGAGVSPEPSAGDTHRCLKNEIAASSCRPPAFAGASPGHHRRPSRTLPLVPGVDAEGEPGVGVPVRRASVVAGSSRSVASIDAKECRSECQRSRSSRASSFAVAFASSSARRRLRSGTGLPVSGADNKCAAACAALGAATRPAAGGARGAAAPRARPPPSSAALRCRRGAASARRGAGSPSRSMSCPSESADLAEPEPGEPARPSAARHRSVPPRRDERVDRRPRRARRSASRFFCFGRSDGASPSTGAG